MAKLSSAARSALPTSAFAIPETRSFPIHDEDHARAALMDVGKKSPAIQARVRKAVYSRYPHMEKDSFDHIKAVNE